MIKAFYCKGRPQGADIAEFSIRHGRVFIGYPPWRRGEKLDRNSVRDSIFDIAKEDPSKAFPIKHRRQFTKNRNLVHNLGSAEEAYVFVPRPGQGVCFIGRVTGQFRVENAPPWVDEYFSIRKDQKLDCHNEAGHVGDVVQCWKVNFSETPIPFPLIPGWIRYQIMSRQTAGLIHNVVEGIDEISIAEVAQSMYKGSWFIDLNPTLDFKEIERRLIRWLTPRSFEHLAVNLLQLEHPNEQWLHVGGSGDGGADGLAFKNGRTTSVLQCKWRYIGDFEKLASCLKQDGLKVFVAALIYDQYPNGDSVLDRC